MMPGTIDSITAAVRLWCWLALGLVLGGGLGFVVAAGVGASRTMVLAEILFFALIAQAIVAAIVCGVFTIEDGLSDDPPLGIGS